MTDNPIEALRSEAIKDNKEYDVRFCKCGTIHFIDRTEIEESITNNKELILICGGCGMSTIIGADVNYDYGNSENLSYDMYSKDFNQSFTTTKEEGYVVSDSIEGHVFSSNPIIRYSIGKRPRMLTGNPASQYYNGRFQDTQHPDLDFLSRAVTTLEETKDYLTRWERDKSTVNMNILLHYLTDDELRHLSHYVLEGFDWSDTKYETDYNKTK